MTQLLLKSAETVEILNEISDTLYDREMIFCYENNTMYIKVDDKLEKVDKGGTESITVSSDKVVSLNEDLYVKGITVTPDDSGVVVNGNKFLGSFAANKKYLPILRYSTSDLKAVNGLVIIYGQDIKATYHISLCSSGNAFIQGSSSYKEKEMFAKFKVNGTTYVGLVNISTSPANVYLHGFDTRDYDLAGMDFTNSNVTNIENI